MTRNVLRSSLPIVLLGLVAVVQLVIGDAYCAEHEAICIAGCCSDGDCPREEAEHGEPPCCIEVQVSDDLFLSSGVTRLDLPQGKDLPSSFGDDDCGNSHSEDAATPWIYDHGPPVFSIPSCRAFLGVYLL